MLDRPDVLRAIAFEVVEDCREEGTRKVELRFAPSFVSEYNSMKWEDVLDGFHRGVQRALKTYPEMRAGFICIASRDFGPDEVAKVVDFYLANRASFVGVDLAGNEDQNPCRLFQSSFKKAIAAGANITIHSGEASGPENMWEAIELLGARRIGHGIACVKDPELMKYLAKNQICLEMCPTSNWITRAVPSYEEHPLPTALRAGVPVCINTDDPTVFGVTMHDEIEICLKKFKMTPAEIDACHSHAERASFLKR